MAAGATNLHRPGPVSFSASLGRPRSVLDRLGDLLPYPTAVRGRRSIAPARHNLADRRHELWLRASLDSDSALFGSAERVNHEPDRHAAVGRALVPRSAIASHRCCLPYLMRHAIVATRPAQTSRCGFGAGA